MTRNPSASEVYARLPVLIWFRAPDEVDRLYPDLAKCDRPSVVSKIVRKLGKEMKSGNVLRVGPPGHYEFMILQRPEREKTLPTTDYCLERRCEHLHEGTTGLQACYVCTHPDYPNCPNMDRKEAQE